MSALGHNNPPALTPFEAVSVHIDDLYAEARNWLDGATIENQAQADALGQLMDALRQSRKAADEARKVEAKPFDDGKAEVQARYKPLLDKADRAVEVAKAALGRWLAAQDAARRAAADEARRAAEAQAKAAQDAARAAAKADDLDAKEAAEKQVKAAQQAETEAKRIEASRPQVTGGARAVSMRTHYTPEIADFYAALEHYVATQPEAFQALILDLARKDIAAAKRAIPGVKIITEQRVA